MTLRAVDAEKDRFTDYLSFYVYRNMFLQEFLHRKDCLHLLTNMFDVDFLSRLGRGAGVGRVE